MTKSIHLLCRRGQDNRLQGLTRNRRQAHTYHSSCWVVSEPEALSLIGGWLYLHPRKSAPSEMGGRIVAAYPMKREGNAIENGFTFVFESRREAKNRHWRARRHARAWTSGVIDATYPHEA